jgi:hypothetical protein
MESTKLKKSKGKTMQKYNKTIVAVIGAIVGYVATNCTGPEVNSLVALATAVGVYAVPNKLNQ